PGSNRPPRVVFVDDDGGQCSPAPGRPCRVFPGLRVLDPDGDPISFSWTGVCAGSAVIFVPGHGTEPDEWLGKAICSLPVPGRYESMVTLRDGRGGETVTVVGLDGL